MQASADILFVLPQYHPICQILSPLIDEIFTTFRRQSRTAGIQNKYFLPHSELGRLSGLLLNKLFVSDENRNPRHNGNRDSKVFFISSCKQTVFILAGALGFNISPKIAITERLVSPASTGSVFTSMCPYKILFTASFPLIYWLASD